MDLGALGVVGPAGAPGGPGPQGPQGFQGPPGPGQVLGVFTEASNGQMQNALLAVPNVATLTYDCLSSQAGSNRVRLYLAERTGAPIWSTRTPLYTLPGTESVFFDLIGTTTMASSLIVAVDSVVINVAPSTTITVWSVIQPTIGNCRLSAQAVTGP